MTPGGTALPAALPGLKPLQRYLGITRLADITGLDCAGIPVVQAVRPFSKSNAVSQGKGATLGDAARSAVMESAESFFAERLDRFRVTIASAAALGIPAGRFAHHADGDVHPQWGEWDIAWIAARNLIDDTPAPVPLELVHTAYVVPAPDYDGIFHTSTTGLAAANSAIEAVRHGVLECVERDAIARALRTHGFLHDRRIDPRAVRSAEFHGLLRSLHGRDFLVGLWLAPAAGHIPVVWCHLMEDCAIGQAILPNPAEGSAARMTLAEAAVAALREAAQSRLAAISGARDDVGRDSFRTPPDPHRRDAHRRLLAATPAPVRVPDHDEVPGGDAAEDVQRLVAALQGAGLSMVYEISLDTAPLPDLHAVKIVIPQLLPLRDG